MRRRGHAGSWSVLGAVAGTMLLLACDSTEAADGETAHVATSRGGTGQQSSGGTSPVEQGGEAGSPEAGSAGVVTSEFRCQSDDDCCAVSDPCLTTMQVVGLPYKEALEADIAANPKDRCTSCLAPSVQVTCVDGQCLGYKVGFGTWPPSGLAATHCGALPVATGGTLSGSAGSVTSADMVAPSGGVSAGGTTSTLETAFGCG
jgi:hypothetical protein